MNEICLHCHWLYFSSIILSFRQCVISIIFLGGKSIESNLKNLDWSFPQALKSMTDQDFNESDVQTKKASITFLGRNITSTLGIQLFKFLSIIIPLIPTLVLVLYNGIQVRNIWYFSHLVPEGKIY